MIPDRHAALAADLWAETDTAGVIVDISRPAAEFLSMTPRGSIGKKLPNFFVKDRVLLVNGLLSAAAGQILEMVTEVRPRDRRLRPVRIDISAMPYRSTDRVRLKWILEPLPGKDVGVGS